MNTQKFIGLIACTALLCSCEKDPDLNELDNDFTVYTQYDEQASFNTAATYYLPDSILTIGDGLKAVYWKDENAQKLLSQIDEEMATRGYTRTGQKETADLGIQPSYIETNTQVSGWIGGGLWDSWWNPGFWGPYWGGGWYYPYPVSYNYSTGSMVLEMVDLRHAPAEDKETAQLPVIWRATSSGLLSGNNHLNFMLVQRAIEQSFQQSSYINR